MGLLSAAVVGAHRGDHEEVVALADGPVLEQVEGGEEDDQDEGEKFLHKKPPKTSYLVYHDWGFLSIFILRCYPQCTFTVYLFRYIINSE